MSYRLLLVEDDTHIQEIISDYVAAKSGGQMDIISAFTAGEAEEALYEYEFDLILLDVMIPEGDGFSLCRQIRINSAAPIIFITARGREEDRLYGYELGCDDYVVKPFSLAELYAKIKVLLKRSKGMALSEKMTVGGICLDVREMKVTANGDTVELTPKLYGLLKYLMEHKNSVAGREELLIRIWGYDFEGSDRVVDNHIKKLRRALGPCGSQIKTVFSKGYRMEE